MIISDFEKLRIGQEIYYKGVGKTINYLADSRYTNFVGQDISDAATFNHINFVGSDPVLFNDIMSDLSLDAPKPKREWTVYRYWYFKSDLPDYINHTPWICETWEKRMWGKDKHRYILVKTESKIVKGD